MRTPGNTGDACQRYLSLPPGTQQRFYMHSYFDFQTDTVAVRLNMSYIFCLRVQLISALANDYIVSCEKNSEGFMQETNEAIYIVLPDDLVLITHLLSCHNNYSY